MNLPLCAVTKFQAIKERTMGNTRVKALVQDCPRVVNFVLPRARNRTSSFRSFPISRSKY